MRFPLYISLKSLSICIFCVKIWCDSFKLRKVFHVEEIVLIIASLQNLLLLQDCILIQTYYVISVGKYHIKAVKLKKEIDSSNLHAQGLFTSLAIQMAVRYTHSL